MAGDRVLLSGDHLQLDERTVGVGGGPRMNLADLHQVEGGARGGRGEQCQEGDGGAGDPEAQPHGLQPACVA